MLKKVITVGIIGSVLVLSGCSDSGKATQTLKNQGYTNISIDGYAWFMCSEQDTFATKFYATSPNWTRVSGAVCSGLFKGNTLRFD
uniref:Lipoprotein n=1 Tax=Vibrio phage P018-4 TaxID=3229728 RepID=A0AB39AJQ4_9CAUD